MVNYTYQNEILSSSGKQVPPPRLVLQVRSENAEAFDLEREDIEKVFSHFGNLRNISLCKETSTAYIEYLDVVHAFLAQQTLHNHYLKKYNATLDVRWAESAPGQF